MGGAIDRCVEVEAADVGSLKTALFDQLTERVVYFHVQGVGKITGKQTLWGAVNEDFHGRQQGTIAREPDRFMRPQTLVVEASDLAQSVVAAAVGIAR